MQDNQQLYEIFKQGGGLADFQNLRDKGISSYQLNRQLEQGKIARLRRGVYRWNDFRPGEWLEVTMLVKEGVFCLYSACELHHLSTFISQEYHLAIPDKSKVKLPEYPPVKLYYWDETPFKTGISEIEADNGKVKVYDLEKTVCDAIRYRNKAGFDFMKEVVRNYLDRPDRNLAKLQSYTKKLGISGITNNIINLML